MMARLKVLIDRIGLEEFRSLVDAELAEIGPIDPKDYIANEDIYSENPPELPPVSPQRDRQWQRRVQLLAGNQRGGPETGRLQHSSR